MAHAQKATVKEKLYIESLYAAYIEKDIEKCIRLLNQLVEKYPKEKRAHLELGYRFYNWTANWDKAIAECKKALELDPHYTLAINALAIATWYRGDHEKALELFKKYAALSPGDANPLDSMAHLYFLMGRVNEAIASFQEALRMKPDFYISIIFLQYIFALRQDYAEVTTWLDRLIAAPNSLGINLGGNASHLARSRSKGRSDSRRL
jgi:tetratricopeptide (TPR) repeat protein